MSHWETDQIIQELAGVNLEAFLGKSTSIQRSGQHLGVFQNDFVPLLYGQSHLYL